ncbi:Reverse transcriptase [Phytophthora palmivora]|uniref:Reverse transcriptase n=1 Tax=Phytophthora palmivora TaxID=4796 RepID=A0A2P4YLA8_9STRA|nr:Reverse transcriptase [Phytophthora palmivora]
MYLLLTRDFYCGRHTYVLAMFVNPGGLFLFRSLATVAADSIGVLEVRSNGLRVWTSGWKTGIVVFVGRFSKMVHLAADPTQMTSQQIARLFVDMVFKHHGVPSDFGSDRDPASKHVSSKRRLYFLEPNFRCRLRIIYRRAVKLSP